MLRIRVLIECVYKALAAASGGMFVLSCLCYNSFAQDQDTGKKLVTLSASVSPEVARLDESITLSVKINLAPGAHANSNRPSDPYLIPTTFTPKAASGVSWGHVKYPEPSEVSESYSEEPLSVFVDGAVISVPITIGQTAVPGKMNVEGSLRIQICDDQMCYPAQRLPVIVPVIILSVTETTSGVQPDLRETKLVTDRQPSSRLRDGEQVQNFSFIDFNGKTRNFSEYLGKYVLIDFWATWCRPCLADIPKLKELYEKHKADSLEILGMDAETLSDDEEPADPEFAKKQDERARQIVRTRGVTWTQAVSTSAVPIAKKIFGVKALPTKILIDKEGKVVARIGENDDLTEIVGRLLSENR